MTTFKLMEDEARKQYEMLGTFECGSDESRVTADVANSVVDRLIEMDKNDTKKMELKIKEKELELREMELVHEKKDRKVKNIITMVTGVVTLGTYFGFNILAMRFEDRGNIHTTETGKSTSRNLSGIMDKLLKK